MIMQRETELKEMAESTCANEIVPEELKDAYEIVDGLNPEEKNAVRVLQQFYSGPLPPAEELAKYNEIDPDAHIADRILKAFEKNVDAEIDQKNRRLNFQGRDALLGTLFSFMTVIFVFSVGSVLIYFDKPIAGMASLITALATIIKLFIYPGKTDEKNGTQ